jgi:mannose-6-phosphate isomerase-like protein (cupin superfamily)
MNFAAKILGTSYDSIALDGSEIRLLLETAKGGVCHCSLRKGEVSKAIHHNTVDEIWFFLKGEGELWRIQNGKEEVVLVHSNMCIAIPQGMYFQYRNTGQSPLEILITTIPPWPVDEENEVVFVENYWKSKIELKT